MYTDFMKTGIITIATISAVLGFASQPGYGAESDTEAAARLRGEIAAAIGEARCRNLVNCRIVGLGVRPCGGPEEYVAYSIWDTDREHISNLVSEYNLVKEDLMMESELVGTCQQLTQPGVDCVHARCVIVPHAN